VWFLGGMKDALEIYLGNDAVTGQHYRRQAKQSYDSHS
jgi:hypothetical protein